MLKSLFFIVIWFNRLRFGKHGYFISCLFTLLNLQSQDKIHAIEQLISAQNYTAALDKANIIITETPNNDSAIYLKGYIQLKLNQLKEANLTVNYLQKINPNYYESFYLKGLIYSMKGKYADAIQNFNKVISANSNHEKAWYNMALAKGLLEDYSSAIKDLDKCISINSNYTMAFYNRAYWYEVSENYNAAILDYKKAISIDKHYSEAYVALAYVYSKNGDAENACEVLNTAKNEGIEAANDLIQLFCK